MVVVVLAYCCCLVVVVLLLRWWFGLVWFGGDGLSTLPAGADVCCCYLLLGVYAVAGALMSRRLIGLCFADDRCCVQ